MGTGQQSDALTRSVFRGALWIRALYFSSIAMGVIFPVLMYREGDRGWVVYLPIAFFFLGFFAWPRAIHLDGVEIRKRDAFLQPTRIPVSEISSVVLDASRAEVSVFGKNGENIVLSYAHVGANELVDQLEAITGKEAIVLGV